MPATDLLMHAAILQEISLACGWAGVGQAGWQ